MVRNGNSARGAASRPLSACDVIHALKTNRTDLKSRDTSSHQGPDRPSSIVTPIAQPIAIPSLTENRKAERYARRSILALLLAKPLLFLLVPDLNDWLHTTRLQGV